MPPPPPSDTPPSATQHGNHITWGNRHIQHRLYKCKQTLKKKEMIKTSAGLPGEIFLTNTRKRPFLSISYVQTGGGCVKACTSMMLYLVIFCPRVKAMSNHQPATLYHGSLSHRERGIVWTRARHSTRVRLLSDVIFEHILCSVMHSSVLFLWNMASTSHSIVIYTPLWYRVNSTW